MASTSIPQRGKITWTRKGFDPELLYIQCSKCGSTLDWEKGETTDFLLRSGLDAKRLDFTYLILSHGCSDCSPEQFGYVTQIIHLDDHAIEGMVN